MRERRDGGRSWQLLIGGSGGEGSSGPRVGTPCLPSSEWIYDSAGYRVTEDLIETYIAYKYENEIEPVRLRPTPQEFEMYYDC